MARRDREERERVIAETAAQAARFEQHRRDISSSVRLSATMNNGREPLALADVTESGHRSAVTLRRGDTVLGATVAVIDDRSGTMQLDVDGKARLSFRVGSVAP